MLKAVVVFLTLVNVAFAAVYWANLEPKPEEYACQEGCYISDLQMLIPIGKSGYPKNSCTQYNCMKDIVQIFDCGSVEAVDPCYVSKGKGEQYPDCCSTITCP